jgi:methylated-DNA-[protein]-cysteine S-methyltransferase
MKDFFNKCYKVVGKIPKGKVSTYKAVARALGTNAYRAVGNAMNKNPHSPKVPCHRVIKNNGDIGGFAKGKKEKIRLLKKEGVVVEKERVNLEKFGYFFKN